MKPIGKKGDMAVTLLVIMALVLSAAALFSFISSNSRIQAKIIDGKFIQNIYLPEEKIKFYVKDAAETAIARSYNELIQENLFNGLNLPKTQDGILVFDSFDSSSLNFLLAAKLSGNFNTLIQDYDIDYKKEISEKTAFRISDDALEISADGIKLMGSLSVVDKKTIWIFWVIPTPFTKDESKQLVGISYVPKINLSISWQEIGLNSFSEIYSAVQECKTAGNMQACLSQTLESFNIIVNIEGSYKKIHLTSKKKFWIDSEFRQIQLEFLI